ncbi:MAG: hypothetical protein Q8T09_04095 [Candidatus Melainabacteria bacterium]|nr:hypothetical protein [Candidatus Melainabacteria bacterium]
MKSKDYFPQKRKELRLILVAIFALFSILSLPDCAASAQGETVINASSFSQVDYRYNRRGNGYGYNQYRRWPYQQYYPRPYYPRQYYRPPYYQRPQYQCWYVPVYDRYGYVAYHRRVCR